jgi:hypothetical protein
VGSPAVELMSSDSTTEAAGERSNLLYERKNLEDFYCGADVDVIGNATTPPRLSSPA